MQKWFLPCVGLILVAGCAVSRPAPLRQQVHTGITMPEVWQLYDYRIGDSNSPPLPAYVYSPTSEYESEGCTYRTYRHWLLHNKKEQPFLLTFQTCRLPNYDAVQEERQKTINEAKKILENNPDIQQEFDAFCKENQLPSEDRDLLIEALFMQNQPPLPRCKTDSTLVSITPDEHYTGVRPGKNRGVLESIGDARRSVLDYRDSILGSPRYRSSRGGGLQIDAYGPGVHSDQYGRPVTLRPDFGGVPGERLEIRPDAYGPGVHSDQYGRPVREYPWP